MSEFAKTIQRGRKEKGFILEELSEKIGVDKSYLSKLENDRVDSTPSAQVLKGLAEALDLDYENISLLAGRMSKDYVEDLDDKKVLLFRAMKGKRYNDNEFNLILKKLKKDDNKE